MDDTHTKLIAKLSSLFNDNLSYLEKKSNEQISTLEALKFDFFEKIFLVFSKFSEEKAAENEGEKGSKKEEGKSDNKKVNKINNSKSNVRGGRPVTPDRIGKPRVRRDKSSDRTLDKSVDLEVKNTTTIKTKENKVDNKATTLKTKSTVLDQKKGNKRRSGVSKDIAAKQGKIEHKSNNLNAVKAVKRNSVNNNETRKSIVKESKTTHLNKTKEKETEKETNKEEKPEKLDSEITEKEKEKESTEDKDTREKTVKNPAENIDQNPTEKESKSEDSNKVEKRKLLLQPKFIYSIPDKLRAQNNTVKSLYLIIKSKCLSRKEELKLFLTCKNLYSFFISCDNKNEIEQIKEKIKEKNQILDRYMDLDSYLNKYFTISSLSINSMTFLSKAKQQELLNSKEIPNEIHIIYKVIYYILDESFDENESANKLIENLITNIFDKYKVSEIKNLFINFIKDHKTLDLTKEKYTKINEIFSQNPKILKSHEIAKINRPVSYITFFFQEVKDYINLKTLDGVFIFELRNAKKEKEELEEKLKELEREIEGKKGCKEGGMEKETENKERTEGKENNKDTVDNKDIIDSKDDKDNKDNIENIDKIDSNGNNEKEQDN